jgi:hypothetical protein
MGNSFTTSTAAGATPSIMRATEYISIIEHALGGEMDSRLDPLLVVNQALAYLMNMHDWKFRKRPPLDVCFQTTTSPTVVTITSIARLANVVTVQTATAPIPGFSTDPGAPKMIVANCSVSSFNGTFTLASVLSTTSATWAQSGSDESAAGGTVGAYPYEQFIDLPSDFGELISVCTKNNAIASIVPTGLSEIAWRRGTPNAVAYDGLYRCALSFPGQLATSVMQAVPRLEIWPRPWASNTLGDLTLTYRAKEIALTTTPDTVPNFPPKFERLLCLLCRLFAQGYEEELVQEDPIIQAEVAMLLEADGRQELNIGLIKGGAVAKRRIHQIREFRTIPDPANRTV